MDTANLQERYTKEIEQLRGKLRELKGEQHAKYERRRHLFDDLNYTPKELILKTNTTATTNNIVATSRSNSNNNIINNGIGSRGANAKETVIGEVKIAKKRILMVFVNFVVIYFVR